MEKQTMKEIPVNDRPYERCIKQGPEALSDEELLSVIIRTGSRKANSLETARQILRLTADIFLRRIDRILSIEAGSADRQSFCHLIEPFHPQVR